MDSAAARPPSARRPFFEDGLGKRYHAVGPGGEPFDLLVLRDELAAISSFESALRDRVSALTTFQSTYHGRIRGVARLGEGIGALGVASDRVRGERLSNILAAVEQRRLPLELDAALCLIRQLTYAVSMLHELPGGISHGAITPERIVVAPDGQLVIVDHVFGASLGPLHFSRERYWQELGLPLPNLPTAPHFDQRTDVLQVGMVALALILGRPIHTDEYPEKIGTLAELASSRIAIAGLDSVPAIVHTWLARTLEIDVHQQPFASGVDAWDELGRVLGESDYVSSLSSLRSFLVGYAASAGPRSSTTPLVAPAVAANDAESSFIEASQNTIEPSQTTPDVLSPAETAPGPSFPRLDAEPSATGPFSDVEDMTNNPPWWRRRSIAAAAAFILLAGGGALAGRWYLVQPAAAEASGTLVVDTNPHGVAVVVDRQPRGFTPVTLALAAGAHVMELIVDGKARTIPLTITAGDTVSQFVELPNAGVLTGQLQVSTEPPGARLFIDGVPRGVSPLLVDGLTPGTHQAELVNDAGSVKHEFIVHAGATATLVVPMIAPESVSGSGWISVAAPVDVQVYEDGRLLGSSRIDRIMVPTGRHELEIVNEALSFRATRTVTVTPDKVSPVKLDWPTGLIAINAQPWAEVWVDGARVGDTPIGRLVLPIGPHEVVFRHPEFGQQVVPVTVTLTAPARLSVDLRKK